MTATTRRHRRKTPAPDRVLRTSLPREPGEAQTAEPIPGPPAVDATVTLVEFVIVGDPEPESDLVSGIRFDDLVGAPDHVIVDALVMVVLAGTTTRRGNSSPRRGAYLLREAARRLLAFPMEHFVVDDDNSGRGVESP